MTHENEILEMVDRETRAWNERNVDLLLSLFHPDMVWPWPLQASDHDPMTWSMGMGRFDRERWRKSWQNLFDTHALLHNNRTVRRIVLDDAGEGGFAVVDVDTLWRSREGETMHWRGRACKVYVRTSEGWKMIMHTGLLEYA